MVVLQKAKGTLGRERATIFKEGKVVAEKGLVPPAWRGPRTR